MVNKVILLGRIATNIDMKYTPNGVAIATFRLAVGREFKNADGSYDADFLSIKAWRKSAEYLSNHRQKGDLIYIEGRIENRSWEAKDGTRRYATDIIADSVKGISKKIDFGDPFADDDTEGGEEDGGL